MQHNYNDVVYAPYTWPAGSFLPYHVRYTIDFSIPYTINDALKRCSCRMYTMTWYAITRILKLHGSVCIYTRRAVVNNENEIIFYCLCGCSDRLFPTKKKVTAHVLRAVSCDAIWPITLLFAILLYIGNILWRRRVLITFIGSNFRFPGIKEWNFRCV